MKGRSKDDAEKEYVELSRTLLNKYGASKLIDFWKIWLLLTVLI